MAENDLVIFWQISYSYSKEVKDMLCKKTSKNQLTLPKEIVKSFPDTDYFNISVKDGQIVLLPVKTAPANVALESVRDKMEKHGIQESDISEAIRWARKNVTVHQS